MELVSMSIFVRSTTAANSSASTSVVWPLSFGDGTVRVRGMTKEWMPEVVDEKKELQQDHSEAQTRVEETAEQLQLTVRSNPCPNLVRLHMWHVHDARHTARHATARHTPIDTRTGAYITRRGSQPRCLGQGFFGT